MTNTTRLNDLEIKERLGSTQCDPSGSCPSMFPFPSLSYLPPFMRSSSPLALPALAPALAPSPPSHVLASPLHHCFHPAVSLPATFTPPPFHHVLPRRVFLVFLRFCDVLAAHQGLAYRLQCSDARIIKMNGIVGEPMLFCKLKPTNAKTFRSAQKAQK